VRLSFSVRMSEVPAGFGSQGEVAVGTDHPTPVEQGEAEDVLRNPVVEDFQIRSSDGIHEPALVEYADRDLNRFCGRGLVLA
jgi:hypothetical protein